MSKESKEKIREDLRLEPQPAIYRGKLVRGTTKKRYIPKTDDQGNIIPDQKMMYSGLPWGQFTDVSGRYGDKNYGQHLPNIYRQYHANSPAKLRQKKMRLARESIGTRIPSLGQEECEGFQVSNRQRYETDVQRVKQALMDFIAGLNDEGEHLLVSNAKGILQRFFDMAPRASRIPQDWAEFLPGRDGAEKHRLFVGQLLQVARVKIGQIAKV